MHLRAVIELFKSEIDTEKTVDTSTAGAARPVEMEPALPSVSIEEILRWLNSVDRPPLERRIGDGPIATAVATPDEFRKILAALQRANNPEQSLQLPADYHDRTVLERAALLPKEAFSIKETAQILNCSEKTVRRYINRGLLKSSRAMRHHRIPRSEITKFLAKTV